MFKRIISYVLSFAIILSLCVPVSFAVSTGELIYDSSSVNRWNSWMDNNFVADFDLIDMKAACWTVIDRCFSASGCGALSTWDELYSAMILWNKRMSAPTNWGSVIAFGLINGFDSSTPTAKIAYDSDLGVYRFQEYWTGIWLVNSSGYFPYYKPADDESTYSVYRTGQWVNPKNIGDQTALWHVSSGYELNVYRDQWLDLYSTCKIVETENYYWLVRGTSGFVLCDDYGYPFYCPKDGKTAISTPNNYYSEEGDTYLDDDSTTVTVYDDGIAITDCPVDINNGTIIVGGETYYIDELIYDASTQTYHIDAHQEYDYSTETNEYYTYEYTFEVQYNIDYTSITYIGQTEEYDERYELYYELPDGRSSADLTAEDLEQLSIVFKDVVNYARTADNVDLRALYHFDGDTLDSSYWSYITDFEWISGASLTYMDEGTFEGSLYLDETEHMLQITLPNVTDANGDFTLQWRYYQSQALNPTIDSGIAFGTTEADAVIMWDGEYWYNKYGTQIAEMSIGNWNEICVMRSDGILYYYINGVCVATVSDSMLYNNVITFLFGSDQESYKKLDELRFTRAAVYTPGENYTPSAVPFDTNLALILPDGERPMADEVMVITPSQNNLLGFTELDGWIDHVAANAKTITDALEGDEFVDYISDGTLLLFNPSYTTISAGDESVGLSANGTEPCEYIESIYASQSAVTAWSPDYCDRHVLRSGAFIPILGIQCYPNGACSKNISSGYNYSNAKEYVMPIVGEDGTYTLSVVLSDGTYSSVTFTLDNAFVTVDSINEGCPITFSDAEIDSWNEYTVTINDTDYVQHYHSRILGISILPEVGTTCEIAYVELVPGDASDFEITWETAMYSSGELEDAPVLAVRTNDPITSYQIGGVRPSYPETGMVYAMVENSRIVSLQYYNGSAWTPVDGRIWTGTRWIPYGSFDVFTLQDFHDVIGSSGDDYEYIYTESGFWAWFQRQWVLFMNKLDQILEAITGVSGDAAKCSHEYSDKIQREATCTVPGHIRYTCELCGHSYTELVDPVGHDWILQEHVDEVLNDDGSVKEKGYDILVCSVCDAESKDYGDGPIETDIFDAAGDLIAEGIEWILGKLDELADSLGTITETFHGFVDKVKGMSGEYTMFFGAFLTLVPEELMTVFWFGVVALVVLAVWKAWAS